jgi:uncharacterized protein YgiM (DUF1202 family)
MYGKLLVIFVFLSTIAVSSGYPQSNQEKLHEADSLFASQKYTDSFVIYENLLNNSDQFSLRMLLKMAFIKEALGDYTSALYYLNMYYRYQPNKKVLRKMEELAARYKLSGYRYTDLEYFISLYNQYYYYIIFFFISFALTFYLYLIIKKLRKKKMGLRPLIFIIILGSAYYITNYNIIPPKGIISQSDTYLMSAPSAASEPITVTDKGHRVVILGKEDVWYKIKWENQTAYILQSNLLAQ